MTDICAEISAQRAVLACSASAQRAALVTLACSAWSTRDDNASMSEPDDLGGVVWWCVVGGVASRRRGCCRVPS